MSQIYLDHDEVVRLHKLLRLGVLFRERKMGIELCSPRFVSQCHFATLIRKLRQEEDSRFLLL